MQVVNRDNKKPYRARGSRGGRRRKGSQATQAQKIYGKSQNPRYNQHNPHGKTASHVTGVQTEMSRNPMYDQNFNFADRRSFASRQQFERNEYHQVNMQYNDPEFGRPNLNPSSSRPSPRQDLRMDFRRMTASAMYENYKCSSQLQPPELVKSCSSVSSYSSSSGSNPDFHYNEYDNHTLNTMGQQLSQINIPSDDGPHGENWGSFFSTSPRSFLMGRNIGK